MEARYLRNFDALTEEEFRALRAGRVLVVGCGGLGGHLIELLARLGVGSLTVVDGDVFEETNLNRQLLSTEALLGCSKAQAAADRVRAVNSRSLSIRYASFSPPVMRTAWLRGTIW